MKIKTADRFRLALSKRYLDLAESLPRCAAGPIAMLQQVRQRQRGDSHRAYEISRPPEGTEVEFLSFRLIEIYPSEEAAQVQRAILQFFPDLDSDLRHRRFTEDLKHQAAGVLGGAWWDLGVAVREPERRHFGSPTYPMPDLPKEVEYVRFRLTKILPSLFAMTFDVCLEVEATHKLRRLQEAKYLPDIRFQSLLPIGIRGYARSGFPADFVRQRTILSWLERLQAKVEAPLRPLVSGYFASQSDGRSPQLPSIQAYAIRGMPRGKQDITEWIKQSRGWWSSLGFNFYPFELFSGANLMFVLGLDDRNSSLSASSYRLVVLWEAYLETLNTQPYGGDERAAVQYDVFDRLEPMLPVMAVLDFLKYPQKRIGELRQNVFGRLKRGKVKCLPSFMRLIKTSDEILLASVLLDRVSTEFRGERGWLAQRLKDMDKLIRHSPWSEEHAKGLATVMLETVEFRMMVLERLISSIEDWFSQYLTLRNMAAIYWLEIIVAVVTVAGIIGLKNIGQFFTDLILRVQSFLQ